MISNLYELAECFLEPVTFERYSRTVDHRRNVFEAVTEPCCTTPATKGSRLGGLARLGST
jgi:hypothetical protein